VNIEGQDKTYIDGLHGLLNILEQRSLLDKRMSRARLADLDKCFDTLVELIHTFEPGEAKVGWDKFDAWILHGLHKILRMLAERLKSGPLMEPKSRHAVLDLVNSVKKPLVLLESRY
jgi:hypothetical protein